MHTTNITGLSFNLHSPLVCSAPPPPLMVVYSITFCTFIRLHHPATDAVVFTHHTDEGTSVTIGTTFNGVYVQVSPQKQNLPATANRQHRRIRQKRDVGNRFENASLNDYYYHDFNNFTTIITTENDFTDIINFMNKFNYDEKNNTELQPSEEDGDSYFEYNIQENDIVYSNTIPETEMDDDATEIDEDGSEMDEDANEMHLDEEHSIVSMKYYFEPVLSPNIWHHVCLSYDDTTKKVRCLTDGQEERLSSKQKITVLDSGPNINNESEIFIQPETCFGSNEFLGDIANSKVFNKPMKLLNQNIRNPCLNETFEATKPVMRLSDLSELEDFDIEDICKNVLYPLVMYDTGLYEKTYQQCQSLDGRLMEATDINEEIRDLVNELDEICRNVVEDTASWIHTSETFEKTVFHECKGLSFDGKVVDVACVRYIPCSICLVKNVRASLYGHKGTYFDHVFHLEVKNGEGIWKGRQGSTIVRKEVNWVLSSPLHKTELVLYSQTVPIGRQIWNSSLQHNIMPDRLLALSKCKTFQFSCNDGTCIDISYRCDDVFHCSDLSDELSCNVVKLSSTYDEFYEPPPRPGETFPSKLIYDTEIYHMGTMTTDEGRARLDLGITVSWYDPRLDFTNLKLEKKNYFDCTKVWKPSIRAVTGKGDGTVLDTKTYEEQCYTTPKFQKPSRSMSDPWMSHSASGLSYPLEYHVGLLASFPCDFYLSRYPFDSQKCNVSFMVMNAPGTKMFVKSTAGVEINYLNDNHLLLEYELLNLTTESSTSMQGIDNNTYFLLTIHLERLYGYHIMNSYFPSLLMSIISYSTFYFKINDFYDRILVSLTSHFILASLFIAVTKNSTKTPYLKLIDVWYAIVMTYCFLVIIIQVFINGILHCWKFPCCWDFLCPPKDYDTLPKISSASVKRLKKGKIFVATNNLSSPIECDTSASNSFQSGKVLNVEDEKNLYKRKIVAGRVGHATSSKRIAELPMLGQMKDLNMAEDWETEEDEIEIILSDDTRKESTSTEVKRDPQTSTNPNNYLRKLSVGSTFSAAIPMAKILSISAFINSKDYKSMGQSAAKRNVNKMGPGVRAATCPNSLAKSIMSLCILGYLITYFIVVTQFV